MAARRRTDLINLALGKAAEDLALSHLQAHGLRKVARNYRCRLGEIDLVMRDREVLVIVEVRHRGQKRFVPAAYTVDIHKQRKLIRATLTFLSQHPSYADDPIRFDVVALDVDAGGTQTLNWIRDAFRPE
jgi:putative endonuclease